MGYPRNSLHNYKKGVEPSGIRLIELAHYFGVRSEYLQGMSDEPKGNLIEVIVEKLKEHQDKEACIFSNNGYCTLKKSTSFVKNRTILKWTVLFFIAYNLSAKNNNRFKAEFAAKIIFEDEQTRHHQN